MDLKAYQALKAQRRQLEAEFSKTPADKIRSQLEEIAEKLKNDPPTVETLYGAIGQSREAVDMAESEEGDEPTEE